MAGPELAVVVPALNEAATVASVVAGVAAHAAVIVVDDGSCDGTGAAARAAGAAVVRHQRPRGYDAALESGLREAVRLGCRYAVTMDADGQHVPDVVVRFAEPLQRGYELVVGVRPRPARVAEALFATYTRRAFGVRDPLCGMKGYDMRLFTELGHFDSYRSIGTELMLYGLRRGCRVAQVPVPVRPRRGRPSFGGAVRGNWRILRALVLGLARA